MVQKTLITKGKNFMGQAKRYILIILAAIALIALVYVVYVGSGDDNQQETQINDGLLASKSFSVDSKSTNLETCVKGTIFLSGEDGVLKNVKIVAEVIVDPEDWGGAAFYVPKGWDIDEITSSWQANGQPLDGESVGVWKTGSTDYEWNKFIEIGTEHNWTPSGGGRGLLIIELSVSEGALIGSSVFNLMVAIGFEEREGIKVMHPDYEVIETSIT